MTKLQDAILIFLCATIVSGTTEWFGDLRAHLNPKPAQEEPFYDVIYDDKVLIDCPQGLKSTAIPEYVFFGAMLSTFSTNDHNECLQQCVSNSKCKAINFFEPLSRKDKGFCELLTENQWDNPRLMRPFKKATYYENVGCKGSSNSDSESGISRNKENLSAQPNSKRFNSNIFDQFNGKEAQPLTKSMMKKLASKIHEFNMRFRS